MQCCKIHQDFQIRKHFYRAEFNLIESCAVAAAAVPAEDSGCSNSPGLFSGEGPGGHPPSFFSKERAVPADGVPP